MKKSQTQIVSVILIIFIALAALSAIVPWSMNMIQKRKDTKSVEDVYNFFLLLDSEIRNIAENGGQESLTLNVPGKLTISPDALYISPDVLEKSTPFKNTITFTFTSKVSNVAIGGWIPLNTPNFNETGVLGNDPIGVIFAKADKKGDILEIQYKLWYRELSDPISNKKFKIILNTTDNQQKETTTGFLRIQRLGSYTSQSLTITEINIIV